MQEERRVANGTEKRKPSGPFAYGENEDSPFARGELRSSGCRDRSPSGHLDLRCFEDPDENFVYLVNSVPYGSILGVSDPTNDTDIHAPRSRCHGRLLVVGTTEHA